MTYFVYILYSPINDKHYIGSTNDLSRRLKIHNQGGYGRSYTSNASDWEVFYKLSCRTREQANQIEKHIKRMRNRNYFMNLKKYPEIGEKLLERYK